MTNISLTPGEQATRAASIRATGSAAPIQFAALVPVSPVVTHCGHAAQYGATRRYGPVRGGVFHTTESDSSMDGALRYDARRPETVSCTMFAGVGGELGYDVPVHSRAWTQGRWNDEVESLEVIGKAAWTAAMWRARPKQIEAMIRWTVDLCERRDLPAVWLNAQQWAQGASRKGQPYVAGSLRGFTDHRTANDAAISLGHSAADYSHNDVGTGLRTVIFEDVLPEARRRLAQLPPPQPDPDYRWSEGGTVLYTLTPKQRIIDTRIGLGVPAGKLTAGRPLRVPIPSVDGHAGQTAIVNVTLVEPDGDGFGQVDGNVFGEASDLNFVAGQSPRPCATLSHIDSDGTIGILLSRAGAHVIVDLLGVVA